jgi:hypothetical protein
VGFQLFARFNQLLALAVNGALLFLFFSRHSHQGQRLAIALHETIQLRAECLGIKPVGFDPLVALIQLLRADYIALNPKGTESRSQSRTLHKRRALFLPAS